MHSACLYFTRYSALKAKMHDTDPKRMDVAVVKTFLKKFKEILSSYVLFPMKTQKDCSIC